MSNESLWRFASCNILSMTRYRLSLVNQTVLWLAHPCEKGRGEGRKMVLLNTPRFWNLVECWQASHKSHTIIKKGGDINVTVTRITIVQYAYGLPIDTCSCFELLELSLHGHRYWVTLIKPGNWCILDHESCAAVRSTAPAGDSCLFQLHGMANIFF